MKVGLLLSGGMDSIALAWWLRPSVALTVAYGQKAAAGEIAAAAAVCKELKIEHFVLSVDCQSLGSGDMAGKDRSVHSVETDWWPYRNQLLITLTAMKGIELGVEKLLLGTVASDIGHRDGTYEFVAAMNSVLRMQEGNMAVEAPAIGLTTVQLIRRSKVPPGLLAWAHSCHKADVACGDCRGCNKYQQTFEEVGYDLDRPG
jgi:7-cyano-7-deazaguanine synthase